MCIACYVIPVLIGLICALIGYFLGQYIFKKSRYFIQLLADLESCREKSADLHLRLEKLDQENTALKQTLLTYAEPVFDARAAAMAFGTEIENDDLKIVEGIGPKIEELFHAAGVKTWKALSVLPVETCRVILDTGGENYRIHDPSTWPQQCELAYKGKWQELKNWQDQLQAGRE